jgi:hypothetical protein
MPRCFRDELLRRLRNEVPWKPLFQRLRWPHKIRDGQLAFLCPVCQEYNSAVNPRTHLGRCFHCERNFNPIEITMAVQNYDFVTAVKYLMPMLPPEQAMLV